MATSTSNAPHILVYHCVPTRSCRVIFLLEELGIPYQVKQVANPAVNKGILHNDPEFREVNPQGTLPVMRDGDLVMTESIAIMEYLLEQHDPDHKLAPSTKEKTARGNFLKWMTWAETSLSIPMAGWLDNVALLPEGERNAKAAETLKSAVLSSLKTLEEGLAKHPAGLVGDRFSAVDCALFTSVYLMSESKPIKIIDNDSFPRIYEWYQRVKERPAARKAYEKDGSSK